MKLLTATFDQSYSTILCLADNKSSIIIKLNSFATARTKARSRHWANVAANRYYIFSFNVKVCVDTRQIKWCPERQGYLYPASKIGNQILVINLNILKYHVLEIRQQQLPCSSSNLSDIFVDVYVDRSSSLPNYKLELSKFPQWRTLQTL